MSRSQRQPAAAKTNIILGDAPRIYSTNSRSSFTSLSRKCPTRITPVFQSFKSHVRLGDAATEFYTDSIASTHHRSLSGSSSASAFWTPDKTASTAAKLSKKKLLESHLPWKEPQLFSTTSGAMPPNFIHHRQKETHLARSDSIQSEIKLGDYKPTYTTSSNTATSFTEAKTEFGAENFFSRGSRRQRAGAQADLSAELKDSFISKNGVKSGTEANKPGLVLGYDPTEYSCSNSMSRFFDRSSWGSRPIPIVQSQAPDSTKTNIWFG